MTTVVGFAAQLEKVRLATIEVQLQIMDRLTPALEGLQFDMQRIHVDLLLSEPWYRHWRHRWALRKMRQWVTA